VSSSTLLQFSSLKRQEKRRPNKRGIIGFIKKFRCRKCKPKLKKVIPIASKAVYLNLPILVIRVLKARKHWQAQRCESINMF
jgi:hypothetical protein